MAEDTFTLHFLRGRDRLRVFTFEGQGTTLRNYEIHELPWTQAEQTAREIFDLLQRNQITASGASSTLDNLKKSGQVLYDLLIPAQARVKLAATTAANLTLHLDDSLIHLPWELLHDGRNFLCRRFAIGRIANTLQESTGRSVRTLRAPFKVLIIADPRGDLEACYREGLAIKKFLDHRGGVFQVDFKSAPVDIAFVKKNIRDYDIVHYAGHAVFDAADPSASGWLLDDGTLTVAEIIALGGFQAMPVLLFCNACLSGRAQVDKTHGEIYSLAKAFLVAGVQNYIGTLAEIADDAGLDFAESFYQNLAVGHAVGPALRNARHAMAEKGQHYGLNWAKYLLYGEPSATLKSDSINLPTWHSPGGWRRALHARSRLSLSAASLVAILVIGAVYAAYTQLARSSQPDLTNASQISVKAGPPSQQQVSLAPLSLTINLVGQRKEADGSHTEVVIREGSVLRSGDQFQVHAEVNRTCYFYVLLFDSHGEASRLFPDPKIETAGHGQPGHKLVVPEKGLWFWLDEHAGIETVYAIASETPLLDIRGLLSKMEKAGKADGVRLSGDIDQRVQIVERGAGGLGKGKDASHTQTGSAQLQRIKKVTDVVTSTGAVVRAISFDHR